MEFVAAAVLARGDNGQPQVNVSSADAGALLGFADLYPRMEGGALTAAMQFGDRTVSGMLNVRTFFLRDEPSLRRLVTEGSVRVDSNGARVDPTLVRFDRLSAVFSRTGGLLTVRDGVMNGPNIGLTFEGQIDSDRDVLALNGTLIANAIVAGTVTVAELSAITSNLGTIVAGLIRDEDDEVRFDLDEMRLYRTDGMAEIDLKNLRLRFGTEDA